MLIGQITDLHARKGNALAYGVADTSKSLVAAENYLFGLNPPLDALVMTGDLADKGEIEAYGFIKKLFSRWKTPVFAVPGNHDVREGFPDCQGSFSEGTGGFKVKENMPLWPNLSFAFSLGPLDFIMLDSLDPGKHSGKLSFETLLFLEESLEKKDKSRPVLVFAHHPPLASGMGLMDEPMEGGEELLRLLGKFQNARFFSGHLHRAMIMSLGGASCVSAPPVSMQIDLELKPEGGDSFSLGRPAFALHRYERGVFSTHFGQVPGIWPFKGPYSFKEGDLQGKEGDFQEEAFWEERAGARARG
jgi:Icc-related predicted phosphoesterase